MKREDVYKISANLYWDQQYKTVGWQTVHDSGGLEKTEALAEREIDLFLYPTEKKTNDLLYDKENNPYPTMTPDMYLHPSFNKDTKSCVALDYGCGGLARYTAALSSHFKFVYGVDVSVEGVRMGKQRLKERSIKNAILNVCDGMSLKFGDNFFDFIFSNLVLQHIGNKDVNLALAREFGRCLKPGGMMRLEYLDKSQKKADDFFSPVEGNGISAEELEPEYNKSGCRIICSTEKHPWFWITVVKD